MVSSIYTSDRLDAQEAARRFNRVYPGRNWEDKDMALFRVVGVNEAEYVVWEDDVWLPTGGVSLEEAIKVYPRWRSDLAFTIRRAA